jgi:orotate phosphoribosyltransferase
LPCRPPPRCSWCGRCPEAEERALTRTSTADFLDLVGGRQGHFGLESGHHSRLWLDLGSLFADPRPIEPFVTGLTEAIRRHDVSGVCGPLIGGAFLAQLLAQRLAVEFYFAEREMPADPRGLYRARYRVPAALAARVRGKRLAIVDDVMSAGSALRGTYADLRAHGATCVVAGALLVLGSTGAGFFAGEGIPVEAPARRDFELWEPARCPLCAAGMPLEDMAAATR